MRTKFFAFVLLGGLLGWGIPRAVAQTDHPGFKQDMKDAGHSTKDAAKDTGKGIKSGAESTGHAVKHGAKKVTHATAHKTAQGSRKVERHTEPNR